MITRINRSKKIIIL